MSLNEKLPWNSNIFFQEENPTKYRPGGYHPVSLGDLLNDNRYQIHHKLGYGGFSTVWVAKDRELERWVCLKILTADRSKNSQEIQNLRKVHERSMLPPHSRRIIRLLDDFWHDGPNGRHQCIVLELIGPTVSYIVNDEKICGDTLEEDEALKIVMQLLEAVCCMHEAGYSHGDLGAKNLAYTSSCLATLPERELFEVLGQPQTEDVCALNGEPLGEGIPKQMVKSTEWSGWPHDDDELDDNVCVIDLGESYEINNEPKHLAQPAGERAPETILTDSVDHRQDLWRAGLTIYFLLYARLPFSFSCTNDLIRSMSDVLGELPLEWQPRWKQIQCNDKTSHQSNQERPLQEPTIDQEIKKYSHDPIKHGLLSIMKDLTRFLPEDRISASDALGKVRALYVYLDEDLQD